MTLNAFIFSWDHLGVEAIVPITKYELHEQENLMRLLRDEKPLPDPVSKILGMLTLRARVNPQRHYEIYAVDCTLGMDEDFWRAQWEEFPQATAELIREKGIKLYSDRITANKIRIT